MQPLKAENLCVLGREFCFAKQQPFKENNFHVMYVEFTRTTNFGNLVFRECTATWKKHM